MKEEKEKVKTHSDQQTKTQTKKRGESRLKTTSSVRTSESSRIVRETIQMPTTQVVIHRHEFPTVDILGKLKQAWSALQPALTMKVLIVFIGLLASIKTIFF